MGCFHPPQHANPKNVRPREGGSGLIKNCAEAGRDSGYEVIRGQSYDRNHADS